MYHQRNRLNNVRALPPPLNISAFSEAREKKRDVINEFHDEHFSLVGTAKTTCNFT